MLKWNWNGCENWPDLNLIKNGVTLFVSYFCPWLNLDKKWAWNGRKRESDTSRLENMSPFYPETLKGYFLLQVSEVVLNFFSASFQTILNNGRRSSAPVTIPREESKLFMFTNARSLLSRYQINDWRYYIPAFVSTFFPNHFFNFKFNFSLNPTLYDLLTILCMILYRLAQQ